MSLLLAEEYIVVATGQALCRAYWRKIGVADQILKYRCQVRMGAIEISDLGCLYFVEFETNTLGQLLVMLDKESECLLLAILLACVDVVHAQ